MKAEHRKRVILELTEEEAVALLEDMQNSESDFSNRLWQVLDNLALGEDE